MPYMEVLDFSWYEAFKNREGQPKADSIMPMMSWGVTLWIIYSPLFFGSSCGLWSSICFGFSGLFQKTY